MTALNRERDPVRDADRGGQRVEDADVDRFAGQRTLQRTVVGERLNGDVEAGLREHPGVHAVERLGGAVGDERADANRPVLLRPQHAGRRQDGAAGHGEERAFVHARSRVRGSNSSSTAYLRGISFCASA